MATQTYALPRYLLPLSSWSSSWISLSFYERQTHIITFSVILLVRHRPLSYVILFLTFSSSPRQYQSNYFLAFFFLDTLRILSTFLDLSVTNSHLSRHIFISFTIPGSWYTSSNRLFLKSARNVTLVPCLKILFNVFSRDLRFIPSCHSV